MNKLEIDRSEAIPIVTLKYHVKDLNEGGEKTLELFNEGYKTLEDEITDDHFIKVFRHKTRRVPSHDDLTKILTIPEAVHVNMLRGTIAKLTDAQVKHLYPHLFPDHKEVEI